MNRPYGKSCPMSQSTKRFIFLILVLILCWYFGKTLQTDFQDFKAIILKFPLAISGLIFVVLYVGVTFFAWLTKDWFKIIGAVVFGAYGSTLLIWIAEVINAMILFNLSRKFGRGFIEEKFKGRFDKLDTLIENQGFWSIFALRIIPVVPFRFLDLAYGLTKVPLQQYLTIVLLASPLRIFFTQFILAAVGESILYSSDITMLFTTLTDYFLKNQLVLWWGFVYFIAAVVIMLRIRSRFYASR